MGYGNFFPPEISRIVVPRLPKRLQRFTPTQTWSDAEAASVGYSSVQATPSVIEPPLKRPLIGNRTAMVASFGVVLAALPPRNEPVRVVDFGGYDGKYANLVQPLFPEISFDWTVVELPHVVAAMSGRSRPGLAFASDLYLALSAGPDVVLASASLNYIPDPMAKLHIMCAHSSLVVLNRLPLWPISRHAPAIQHTKRRPVEISYPTWFFSESQFMSEIPKESEVILDLECPDDRAAFAGRYSTYRNIVIATRNSRDRNSS